MRRLMIVFIAIICSAFGDAGLVGQVPRPRQSAPAKPAQPTTTQAAPAALTPSSLRADDLNYADDVKRIYVGDFAHVRFGHESAEIGVLVGGYMSSFAERCEEYLPKNKVEIMRQECAQEGWSVNRYNVEIAGSRHCISYRTVGTGKYADPAVYDLQKHLDAAMAGNMLGDMMNGLKGGGGGDLAGGMKKMTDVAVYASKDMDKLLEENGCSNAKMMRFQANLLRFGWDKEAIVMPGGAAAVALPEAATLGPFKDQNYKRLIDDMIAEESQAWMMNRYEKGSVSTSHVARDAQGRPSEVDAGYSYTGMGKPFKGTVRMTFRNGMPECLYFSDFPTTCREPSPRVISAYERHQYAD